MSSAGNNPAAPYPSVFISYASEDRPAARALRDALIAAGLDVWYDESELAGGDAWDQKIRRQIRDCDYFMPVISATTERRKEGYFRREWRLAAERTMDMADDVLFLLPVVIDGTSEASARVPDRFVAVQWLRAPGGQRTPALDALAQRLLAGEHHAPQRPPLIARPTIPVANDPAPPRQPPYTAGAPPPAHAHPPPAENQPSPPPMPPFPHSPEKGGVGPWLKFSAEIVWWTITAAWLLFTRLPRWVRIIVSIWLVFTLLSTCGRNSSPKNKSKDSAPPAAAPDVDRAADAAVEQVATAIEKSTKEKDWGKVGEEIGRQFGGLVERAAATGKPLALAPFVADPQDAAGSQFAQQVFSSCYAQLVLARKNDAAISPVMPVGTTDASFAGVGQQLKAKLVLGLRLAKKADETRTLEVRLIRSDDGGVAWSGEFPTSGADAKETGAKIAEAILPLLPAKK
jgi:hypothetical protein